MPVLNIQILSTDWNRIINSECFTKFFRDVHRPLDEGVPETWPFVYVHFPVTKRLWIFKVKGLPLFASFK